MTKLRTSSMNTRAASLMLLIGVLLSACSGAFDNQNAGLNTVSGDAPVLPSMMAGYTQTQLDAYANWFRTSNSGTPPAIDGSAVRYLNPSCPLELDYGRMLPAGSDLIFPDVRNNSGYYNPAKQETLIVLKGQGFGYAQSSSGGGLACGAELYLPLRVNLGTGAWQIDGYTTPGSTIQITVTGSHEIVPLNGDGDLGEDTTEIVSPVRLNRFIVTDENFERVMRYASVSRRSGAGRHIVWFRQSDVNPVYASMATGNCSGAYYAFWSNGGDGALAPCGSPVDFGDGDDNPYWLDEFARMNASGGKVWEKADDDRCGITGDANNSGACQLGNDGWKQAAQRLTGIAANNDRAGNFAALHDLLEEHGALAENAIPDELGGWEDPDPGVFGVIVANGRSAYDQTRNELNDDETLHRWVGFTGKQECSYDPCGAAYSITVTSSFQYSEVKADEDAARVYNATSLINGGSMRVQPFSSTDAAATGGQETGLTYEQAPLSQIKITVTDPLNAGHTNAYTTEWLPLWAMGRNAGDMTYQTTLDWFGDPLGSMSQMVYEMFYQIYRATFGNWVNGLSQAATSWLVSVPQLDEYAIAYYDATGSPVYQVKKDLIRTDLVTRRVGSGSQFLEYEYNYDTSKLSGNTKTCTEAVLFGSLDVNNPDHEPCFERNRLFDLWFWLRGLAWIFLLGHVFLYGYSLLTRRPTKVAGILGGNASEPMMSPAQFAARVVIAFALIEGMGIILFILQTVVGEVLVVTNLIGTRVAGGEPYSHLWLFNTFLTTAPRGADVLGLFVLAIPTIVGLVVLLMVGWLRYGITLLLLLMTPFWALWLLGQRSPARFYWSLKLMMRMYLMPLLTLVVLLMLFVSMRMLGIGPGTSGGLVGALLSFLMLIAVAIVPFMLSKMVFAGVTGWIETGIERVTKAEETGRRELLTGSTPEHSGELTVTEPSANSSMGQLSGQWDASAPTPGAGGGSIGTSEPIRQLGGGESGSEGVAISEDNEKLFGSASLGTRLRGKIGGARDKLSDAKHGVRKQMGASKAGVRDAARRTMMAGFAGAAWTTAGLTGIDKEHLTGSGLAGAAKSALSYGSLRGALGEAVAIGGANHAWAAAPPWMAGAGSKGAGIVDGWAERAHGSVADKMGGLIAGASSFGALTDTWQSADAETVEARRELAEAQQEARRHLEQIEAIKIDDAGMREMDEQIRRLQEREDALNAQIANPDPLLDPEESAKIAERLSGEQAKVQNQKRLHERSRASLEERLAPALKARQAIQLKLAKTQERVEDAQRRLETNEQTAAAAYAALRTIRGATPLMAARSIGFMGADGSRKAFSRQLADAAERMAAAAMEQQTSRQGYGRALLDDGAQMSRVIEREVTRLEAEMRTAKPDERGAKQTELDEQRALAATLTDELRKFASEARQHGVTHDSARLGETLRNTQRHAAAQMSADVAAAAREKLENMMSSYAAAKSARELAEERQRDAAATVAALERTSDIRRGTNIGGRGKESFELARKERINALSAQRNAAQEAERALTQRVEALRAQTAAAEARGFDAKMRQMLAERQRAAEIELRTTRTQLSDSAEEIERVEWRSAASW